MYFIDISLEHFTRRFTSNLFFLLEGKPRQISVNERRVFICLLCHTIRVIIGEVRLRGDTWQEEEKAAEDSPDFPPRDYSPDDS